MKKVLSLFLALVFSLGICFGSSVIIKANAEESEPKFVFQLNESGFAYELHNIYNASGVVEIPSEYRGLPVESIKLYWQEGNNAITSFVIPETVIEIDGLNDFAGLTELIIPNSVKKISGFQNCSALTEIVIPSSVKEIAEFAFSECLGLEVISINGNLDKLGKQSFSNCTNLKDIKINGSITEIGADIFTETAFFYNDENWNNNGLYIGSTLFATKNLSTEYTVNSETKTIAPGVFPEVETLVLPDNLLLIPEAAFVNSAFTSIEIPASVKKIGSCAFPGILNSVTLNEGLKIIDEEAFEFTCLGTINIPNSVKTIGKNAFSCATIVLGSGVESIDYSVLNNCSNLTINSENPYFKVNDGVVYKGTEVVGCLKSVSGEVSLEKTITKIADYAFKNSSITSINIPNSVTSIGDSAFESCSLLESVTLPTNLTKISKGTFSGCTSLGNIVIPETVEVIENSAFYYCNSLTSITIPDSVTQLDSCFYENASLKEVNIGKNVKSAGALGIFKEVESGILLSELNIDSENPNLIFEHGVLYEINEYGTQYIGFIPGLFDGTLYIPASYTDDIKTSTYFESWYYQYSGYPINKFEVEEGNTRYSVDENGVLYNADKTILEAYPDKEGSFEIPASVKKIADLAFINRVNLSSVVIHNEVTEIGGKAFAGCESLTNIVLPDKITIIGERTFACCSNLETVNLPSDITKISNEAFVSCVSLEEITFGEKITEIGANAFSNCNTLKEIVIPNSVVTIAPNAFSECSNVKSLTIGNGLKSLGMGAFAYCSKLETIEINSEKIENFGVDVFAKTLYTKNAEWINDGIYIGDYLIEARNVDNDFVFKDGIKNFSGVFFQNSEVTNITIPDTVIGLSDYAFSGCESLEKIILGKNISFVGENVFSECKKLNNINATNNDNIISNPGILVLNEKIIYFNPDYEGIVEIPNGVTEISESQFSYSKITGVEIPDTVVTIERMAFQGCENLTEVTLPDSIVNMYDEAFSSCPNLKKVTLSAGLRNTADIEHRSDDEYWFWFLDCTGLEEVIIPEGLNRISVGTFENCVSLKELNLPSTVTSIGSRAFFQCDALVDLVIPDTVTNLGTQVFANCGNLKSLTLSKGVKEIPNKTFSGCGSLQTLVLAEELEKVAANAFHGCTSLKEVTLPENISTIEKMAFGYYGTPAGFNNEEQSQTYTLTRATECDAQAIVYSPKLYLSPAIVLDTTEDGFRKVSNFTIYGVKGSEAECYASENGFIFMEEDNHEHTPKTEATCMSKAVCLTCGEDYGELDSNNHTNVATEWTTGNGYHYHKCECGAELDKAACSGGTATCTKKAVCVACNKEYGDVNTKNHSGLKTLDAVASTCTNTGLTEGKKCFDCGEITVAQTVVNTKGHSLDSGKITTAPTCTKTGVKTYSCTNSGCNFTKTETVPATGAHNQNTKIPGKAATCTATGLTEGAKCSVCGKVTVEQKEIAKLAHNSNTKIAGKAATCTATGLTEGAKCSVCGTETKAQQVIPATGHNSNTKIPGKAATCTATGLTEGAKCSVCGEVTKAQQTVPATGHNSNTKIPGKAATCTATGLTEGAKCSACGEVTKAQQTVPATGHKTALVGKTDATFKVDGYTGDTKCTVCGTVTVKGNVIPKLSFTTPKVAIKNTAKGIEVNWNAVENAQSYVVYRRVYNTATKKWSNWLRVKTGYTSTSYVDESVALGTGYRYTVRAVNGDIMSAYTSTKTLKYDVIPTVKVANVGNGIKVTWSTVANATGYTVYSSTYNTKTKKWSNWSNRGTAKATSTSWVDKKALSGTQYKYTVRACNGANIKSSYKASANLIYLAQPTVKIANASNGVKVSWNKIAGATSYYVYSAQFNPSTNKWSVWTNRGTVTTTSWTDSTAQSGVTYRYTVRAINGKTLSSYKATAGLIYLAQPTVKIANASTGVRVSWSQSTGALGYTVYRAELVNDKWSNWKKMGTAKAEKSSWVDKSAKSGTKYRYTVRAVNGSTRSTYKATGELLHLAQPTVTVKAVSNGINVAWTQSTGAKGYTVYRAELINGKWSNWKNMGTAKAEKSSWVDKSATVGVTYRYTVRAVNGKVRSTYVASTNVNR